LIVDGVHMHPSLVDLAWRVLGPDRLTLVTDAMAALGMPEGRSVLAGQEVNVEAGTVRLPDGTLAGSILSTDVAVRNLMAFTGCTLAETLCTVTATPAAILGLADRQGRIAPGYVADMILMTPELEIAMTIVGGEVVYTDKRLIESHGL
jgi:N-acetylglucosamine-6-phosphate deacetylase